MITLAQRGQTYTLTEDANLTVFNPVQPLQFVDPNDNSIVVKLQVGDTSFLFAGDAEAAAEQSMLDAGLNLKSDVLKVGHHGSDTSTTQPFLNSVSPSYAIISAGLNNLYGHPSPQTIQRLLDKEVTVYGTFQSGTIVAATDGTSMTFQDSPQPIPETHSSIMLLMFMMATLLTAITCARERFAWLCFSLRSLVTPRRQCIGLSRPSPQVG
jgi:competence protein ComEC